MLDVRGWRLNLLYGLPVLRPTFLSVQVLLDEVVNRGDIDALCLVQRPTQWIPPARNRRDHERVTNEMRSSRIAAARASLTGGVVGHEQDQAVLREATMRRRREPPLAVELQDRRTELPLGRASVSRVREGLSPKGACGLHGRQTVLLDDRCRRGGHRLIQEDQGNIIVREGVARVGDIGGVDQIRRFGVIRVDLRVEGDPEVRDPLGVCRGSGGASVTHQAEPDT